MAAQAKHKANKELHGLTGIESATKRGEVRAWLADCELLEIPDTKAKTIEWYLEREEMTPRAKRVLEIVKEVNRTSTTKYNRMLENVDYDNRVRELLLYCGAERTGRYAGRGIQIQNLPKGKWAFKGVNMDTACADVKTGDLEWCESIHGDVMNLLASCLRGSFIAPPGRDLMTADYAAIEARCVLWESGADAALEVFREGGDIYCDMASGIYGYKITKATAQTINSTGATQRDFGKVAVLGLGYGMGFIKFLLTLRTYNIVLTREEVAKMLGAKRLAKYEAIVKRKLFPKSKTLTTRGSSSLRSVKPRLPAAD
jgi:DNA polymerase